MTLPAIYISLYLLTVVLCFIKRDWPLNHAKILIRIHFSLLLVLLLDIFVINFKGVWVDRLLVIAFLLTASATFALYRRTLRTWQKIYFGFFVFYPALAASTFFMDRLMFVIVASPFIATLTIPETRFSDTNYEVRKQIGILAPPTLQLIKKGLITETLLGSTNDEGVISLDILSIEIIKQTTDTTKAVITSKGKKIQGTFAK